MAVDRDAIIRTLDEISAALSAGDAAGVASYWEVPGLVLADEGARPVASRAEIEAFFEASIAAYRKQGTPHARPILDRVDAISERVAAVDVRWIGVGEDGGERSIEASHYLMRTGDDGVPRVQAALSRTAAAAAEPPFAHTRARATTTSVGSSSAHAGAGAGHPAGLPAEPRIHDISQPVGTATAVWPGDRPFEIDWSLRRDGGDAVNVALVTMSVHTGTHIDGGYHFADDGRRAAALPLEPYIGPALVVDATGASEIGPDAIAGIDLAREKRILFRTRTQVDETEFPEPFAHITPELAGMLGEAGVLLVGTDAPSVDPEDSKTLDAHHTLHAGGVAIVENLVLSDVAPGRYTLVALPLKLTEADSSPVRAALIQHD
jgi:arylformamidase